MLDLENVIFMPTIKVQNSSDFSKTVEKLVEETDYNFLEAILYHAQQNGIELETVPKLLTQKLKVKLEQESYDMNRLGKKPSTLLDE